MAEEPAGGDSPRAAVEPTAETALAPGVPLAPAESLAPGATPATAAPDDAAKGAVDNRWWVDMGSARRKTAPRVASTADGEPVVGRPGPAWVAGERLFRDGGTFDADRARSHLSGSNLDWLREANPPEGGWVVLKLTDDRPREDVVERVKEAIRLPRGARGVLLDSGPTLRAIVTGSPVGERICEICLGADCSFDAFVQGDWVCERTFRGRDRALREISDLVARWLAADA
ncbi:MAG: hypothetical protein ACKO2K_06690 [Alphaproteobacteria bacterium]